MGIAVVTGANSGIGLATTIRLAQDGHEVYGAMRDLDKAGDLREACIEAGLDNVNLLRIDVTDDHAVELAFGQVLEQSGPVDILVNNAGIAKNLTVEDAPLESFIEHIEVNYLGTIRCIKQVLPSMRERANGTIVNILSVTGRYAGVTMAAYAGSKFAIEGFTDVLAQEVAPYGIRIVLIEPGTIQTPIFAKAEPAPEGTFYPMHYTRTVGFFMRLLPGAPGPAVVAEAVSEAVHTEDPELRHEVAEDAVAFIAARRGTLTDRELLRIATVSDDEFFESLRHHSGLGL